MNNQSFELVDTSTMDMNFKCYLRKRDHTVVFIDRFINDQSVRSVLLFQNCSG